MEKGFHDATTDISIIDKWWSEADYNLALSPEAAGWSVIDTDGGEIGEGTWAKLQGEHGMAPDTYEVETPSGGVHRYYTGSLSPSVAKLGPKLDTRGRGSYVLVPPSVVDGRAYKVRSEREIADVPGWIEPTLAMFKQSVASAVGEFDLPTNVDRAVAWLRSRDEVTQGDGADARTYEAAAMLRDLGVSPEKSLDLMLAHYKCSPQDDRYEAFITRKIDSAWSYAQNEPGAWGTAPPSVTFGSALDKLGLLTTGEERKPPYYPWTLTELQDAPPVEWVIPELIPRRSWGMIWGPPKTFKTYIALTVVLPVAEREDVVFVAGEGAAHVSNRARAWHLMNGKDPAASRLRVVKEMPYAFDPATVEAFIAAIRSHSVAPSLVVIDTVARAMLGLDEQSAKDVGQFVFCMERIKTALDCSVLAIHHSGKDAARGARGSSALLGGVDFSAEIQRFEKTMAVALRVREQKDAPEREAPWTWEGKSYSGNLVFLPTTRDEHEAMTKGAKGVRPDAVVAALRRLEATDKDHGQPTMVLAEEMLAPLDGETTEQHEEAKGRMAHALNMGAKGTLATLAHGEGRQRVWHLP